MSDIFKMLHTVIKSLFKKPACDRYPAKPETLYDATKGHIDIDASRCILCTLCSKRCPTGAILVDRAARTWKINHFQCILCNSCIENCKPNCLKMVTQHAEPVVSKTPSFVTVNIPEKN